MVCQTNPAFLSVTIWSNLLQRKKGVSVSIRLVWMRVMFGSSDQLQSRLKCKFSSLFWKNLLCRTPQHHNTISKKNLKKFEEGTERESITD